MPGWFQYETTIKTNGKVQDLADLLEMKRVYMRGHLGDFWCFVFDNYKLGVIQGRNLEVKIAEGASWEGDAFAFVNALLECRFIHRSEDAAPEFCEECFPPKEDGTPYDPVPGNYIVHGWAERIHYYLRFEERQRIKREQDAARQRNKRAKEAAVKGPRADKILSVRETSHNRYMPQRRGLRAAPTIVHDKLRHAIESVTSRYSHADEKRDVTLPSRSPSRAGISETPPKSVMTGGEFIPFDPARIPPTTPNIEADQPYSLNRDITQTSRGQKRDVTHVSLPTNLQTVQEPSSKDTSFSPSLNDRDGEKDGANGAPNLASAQDEGAKDVEHQAVMDAWPELYLAATGKVCPEELGRLAGIAARWRKKKYANREIIKRMQFFFGSTFADRRAATYPIMEFQKLFNQLEHGPIVESAALSSNRRSYGSKSDTNGGEDFRRFNPAKQGNDFGPDN